MQCSVVKTLAVHCHCDVCCAGGGLSAGCRTSWFCLQHHATVVTCHGVAVCAARFHLPSVSTAHNNTGQHKTIQQYETPTIPSVEIFKVLLPQPNIMEAFFRRNSSLLCDECPDLPTKITTTYKKNKFLFSTLLSADPLTLPHKLSNYQHTAVHTIQYATSC